MPGFSDYNAALILNHTTGLRPLEAAHQSRFLGLDSASGTEISGNGYARAQFAGAITGAASGAASGSPSFSIASSAPAWLTAMGGGVGAAAWSLANGYIGVVASIVGTTVSITGNTLVATANNDTIYFSAHPNASASSGTDPNVTPASVSNGAKIVFAQSSGTWPSPIGWRIYDALTGGNAYIGDYLNVSGAGKWSPFSCSSGSPGILTVTDQTFISGKTVAVATRGGGVLPTLSSGSWAGLLTVAGVSGNTFNVGLNTTSIGDGMIRSVTPLPVGDLPVSIYFDPGTLTVTI